MPRPLDPVDTNIPHPPRSKETSALPAPLVELELFAQIVPKITTQYFDPQWFNEHEIHDKPWEEDGFINEKFLDRVTSILGPAGIAGGREGSIKLLEEIARDYETQYYLSQILGSCWRGNPIARVVNRFEYWPSRAVDSYLEDNLKRLASEAFQNNVAGKKLSRDELLKGLHTSWLEMRREIRNSALPKARLKNDFKEYFTAKGMHAITDKFIDSVIKLSYERKFLTMVGRSIPENVVIDALLKKCVDEGITTAKDLSHRDVKKVKP